MKVVLKNMVILFLSSFILVPSVTAIYGTRTKRTMDKTDQTKRTTFQDKTDHVSGQNGPRSRTKRIRLQDKKDHVSGNTGPVLFILQSFCMGVLLYFFLVCFFYSCLSYSTKIKISMSMPLA